MKSIKGQLRRMAALCIASMIIAACLPLNIVLANYQSHVRNVTVGYVPGSTMGYNINFTWTIPSGWSSIEDPSAEDGGVYHTPVGYRVESLNATAKETVYEIVEEIAQPEIQSLTVTDQILNSGSIYSFRLLPYHYHTYQKGDSLVRDYAPWVDVNDEKLLFMSDIEVEAEGAGNTLTVTWDNPQHMGNDVFTGYRIYYQRGGSSVTTFNTYKDINISDENIIKTNDNTRQGVQRFTYDIYDSTLNQGEVYAVKVEPMYLGNEVRNLRAGTSYSTVAIGQTSYKLAFKSKSAAEYRTDEAYIEIPLEVNEYGKTFLKLHWWGISNTIGTIDRIEIYSGGAEDDIGTLIGTIYSSQALYVNTWPIDKPTSKTYYQVRVYVDGKETPINSSIAYFDPNIVNITPNKPELTAEVNETSASTALNAYWTCFIRYPYNENEQAFVEEDGTYIDTNVVYNLWISDSLSNVNDPMLPKMLDEIEPSQLTRTTVGDEETPAYMTALTEYITIDENGGYVTKPLEKNKTYYIKLVAVKPIQNETDLSSEAAYCSIYIPTDENISNPQSISKPPLRIKVDEAGNKLITQTSATIEWATKWYEIYDAESDSWYSSAAIRNGAIVFGENIIDSDKYVDFHAASRISEIKDLLGTAGASEEAMNSIITRYVDMEDGDVSYELLYLPLEDINQSGGYLEYIKGLLDSEGGNWQEIVPKVSQNGYAEHLLENLTKNTTYVFILRPYRILSDGRKDAYPSYIVATTLPDETIVEISPTVPILQEVDHNDVSFEVKWEEHIPNLDYELVYSETVLSDPASGGTRISSETIKELGIEKSENERMYMYYTVDRLFPKTGYYVWIRSIAHNSSGDAYSEWSNPLFIETDALEPPKPPVGLGLVSSSNLNIYNKANSLNYNRSDSTYIIVEWLKNYEDIGYTAAANTAGTGYEVLQNPEIDASYIVKFNDLTPNSQYYFRVKARLTVSQGENGSQKAFSYVVQMSPTSDFKDVVEVSVPVEGQEETDTAAKIYVMESEWSKTVILHSEYTDNEYDGNINPDMYPLPDEDYEIIYEQGTQTLIYRFRSNEVDDDDKDDNYVDQRFISRLIQNHVYNFSIDLTSYESNAIKNRVVEMPYSVLAAFNERKISFEVKANNVTFKLPSGFLDTNEVMNVSDFGYSSKVKLTIAQSPSEAPTLSYNQSYVSVPQKLSAEIHTNTAIKYLENTAEDITVSLKLDNRYTALDYNIGFYQDTASTSNWQRVNATYDNANGTINAAARQFAIFSAIAAAAPTAQGSGEITASASGVTSKITFSDLPSYKPEAPVSTVQFNNVIAAIANDKNEAAINTAISTADYNALSKKGLLLSGSVVSREQAVNALVTLYEVKTRRKITYYTPLSQTNYQDIANASPAYQTAMLKAADLGFFDNKQGAAAPKDILSFDDMFYMTNILMETIG